MLEKRSRLGILAAFAAFVGASACVPPPPAADPALSVSAVATGLSIPWDVAWLPDATLLFTQRTSGLFARKAGGVVALTNGGPDVWASGETGVMGLAVDPSFASNRRVYTCQGSTDNSPIHGNSVKVVAWQIDAGVTTATKVRDVVTGIDATSGRHGGCRLEFGPGRALFVTTGDGTYATNPQNLGSLAGKVLRVNPDGTNVPWPGNPFGGSANGFARMVFTYGHRNVQGIAFRANGEIWTAEHGPNVDDEVNRLRASDNYGWNPVPLPYNERVPMTDFAEFPNAAGPQWRSGGSTVATSGLTFLTGAQWKQWEGALAVATLKGARLRIQFYTDIGIFRGEKFPAQFDRGFGRLRTAQQGPDGCLYVTTANGSNDSILRACPS